jgi:hypothetical protein
MKLLVSLCFLVATVSVIPGCGSTSLVSTSAGGEESLNTFNVDAYDRSGTIVFHDGGEVDARNIRARTDSTLFMKEDAKTVSAVPTHTINKVVFINCGVGLLEGIGFGAVGGVVTGLALSGGGGSNEHSFGWGADMAAITLFFGAAGGVVGGIPGVIIGHSYEYQFVTTAAGTKK